MLGSRRVAAAGEEEGLDASEEGRSFWVGTTASDGTISESGRGADEAGLNAEVWKEQVPVSQLEPDMMTEGRRDGGTEEA